MAESHDEKKSQRAKGNERLGPMVVTAEDSVDDSVTQVTAIAPAVGQASVSRKAFLVLIYPPGPSMGKRYELTKETTIIGRGSEADVIIEKESVSRRHARVMRQGGKYVVEDLKSTNGTYLNDLPITEGVLQDGDFLKVGNAIYKFLSGGNVEASYYEEIYRLTIVDGLTRAYNKRYFEEFLEREMARCFRTGRPLSLVMFDIDHFKNINDTYGHLTGDFILKDLCRRIRRTVRRDELLARYGGEEFCVVLPEAEKTGAVEFAERIRRIVEEEAFVFEGTKIHVTISLGVTTLVGEDIGLAAFVQQVDEKLYEAKRTGRNRVVA